MREIILVAVMAIVTALLRFLPFAVFRRHTPRYISYLGRVLPPAAIGMLVVYCLKDVTVSSRPYGIPELAASAGVVLIHVWKRNAIASILGGTAIYMLLVQVVF